MSPRHHDLSTWGPPVRVSVNSSAQEGTPEHAAWLDWRATLDLSASDAPALMGDSPYLGRHGLYLMRTGGHVVVMNDAMREGKEKEEEIGVLLLNKLRHKYVGLEMYPECWERQIGDLRIGASFDLFGVWQSRLRFGAEIKYPGAEVCDYARDDIAPPSLRVHPAYRWQCKAQQLVGATDRHYFAPYDRRDESLPAVLLPRVEYADYMPLLDAALELKLAIAEGKPWGDPLQEPKIAAVIDDSEFVDAAKNHLDIVMTRASALTPVERGLSAAGCGIDDFDKSEKLLKSIAKTYPGSTNLRAAGILVERKSNGACTVKLDRPKEPAKRDSQSTTAA